MYPEVSNLDEVLSNIDTANTSHTIASFFFLDSCPNIIELRKTLTEVSERFPRLRSIQKKTVKGLSWSEVPDFSVDEQLLFIKDESLKNTDDIASAASEVFTKGLQLNRPLWKVVVLAGSGANAILFLLHHSMTDGVGGQEMIETFFSKKKDGPAQIFNTRKLSKIESGKQSADAFELSVKSSWKQWLGECFNAPQKCCLTGSNTSKRVINVSYIFKSSIQQIKREAGSSLNDVLLSLVAGGVKRYLNHKGEKVPSVRAIMPVSLRGPSERYTLGNRLSGAGVDLPINIEDPQNRLRFISEQVSKLKKSGALGAYYLLGTFIAKFPKSVQRFLSEYHAKKTTFIVTNVPGPHDYRFVAGARVKSFHGIPALMKGHGIGLGFMAYKQTIGVSVVSDPNIVKDPNFLLACIEEELREFETIYLRKAA